MRTPCRSAEIESSAGLLPARLRAEVAATAAALDTALAVLDEAAWRAEVRRTLGRSIPATEIPWLRVRELWLHAVDLAAGVQVEDLPPDLVDALLDDVTATLRRRPDCPPVRLPIARRSAWSPPTATAPGWTAPPT